MLRRRTAQGDEIGRRPAVRVLLAIADRRRIVVQVILVMGFQVGDKKEERILLVIVDVADRRVGQRLCDVGVVGRIDIDFLAIEGASGTEACALDINLRKSNTTLPLRTLQLLIGGTYDANTGIYIADCAEPRYYISSDKLGGGRLLGMLPEDLIDIATYTGIHYSSASHTGTVFHMLGGLSESGMVGATCIERTPREAENLYRRTREVLEREFRSYEWMI